MASAMWVRLSNSGAEIGMGNLANASISGAFLETSIKLPVHANITLEAVSTAGVSLQELKIAARVARVDVRGLGIEWRVMATPELLALLTRAPAREGAFREVGTFPVSEQTGTRVDRSVSPISPPPSR